MLSPHKVLDLTSSLAGAWATRLLASYGADVVKVEPPAGCALRVEGPFAGNAPSLETGCLFLYVNSGKRGITLDLEQPDGMALFKGLVAKADVLVTDLSTRKRVELGIAEEALRQLNPGLVITSVTDFGLEGPYIDYKATELTLEALSAGLYQTGYHDAPPVKLGGNQAQYTGGVAAAVATVAALFARTDNRGEHLDVSVMEAFCAWSTYIAAWYSYAGAVFRRSPKLPSVVEGIFPTADGFVCPAFLSYSDWDTLCVMLDAPDLAVPEFADDASRRKNARELTGRLTEAFGKWRTAELVETAQQWGFPFGAVRDVKDLFQCPQLNARHFFVELGHPVAGAVKYPEAPFKMAGRPHKTTCAPILGQHNRNVYRDWLGCPEPELAAAKAQSVALKGPSPRVVNSAPLTGVRIVDWGANIVSPLANKLLALLGAEVIHVESPRRPCQLRMGTFANNKATGRFWDRSGRFNNMAVNKLSLCLDLSQQKGVEIFKKLVQISDVVTENWAPRVKGKLGLTYEDLAMLRSDIIMLSASGYGATGPWADRTAYGFTLGPVGGIASLTGDPDRSPVTTVVPLSDVTSGYYSALAIVIALEHRRKTGQGQWIDLSELECAAAQLGEAIVCYAAHGEAPGRTGNRHPAQVHGVYPCRGNDEWAAIAIASEEEWQRFVRAMENPYWAAQARFSTAADRLQNQAALDQLIGQWTVEHDKYELTELLQRRDIACGAVATSKDIFHDPQLKARGYFTRVAHPETPGIEDLKTRPYSGLPFKTHASLPEARRAPTFGRDNHYVLGTLLNLSSDEISCLAAEGVISDVPIALDRQRQLYFEAPLDAMLQNQALREVDPSFETALGVG